MRGPAIVDPRAGAWKTRILDQAFWCGWRLCSVPNESWVARGPGGSPAWLVPARGAPLLGISISLCTRPTTAFSSHTTHHSGEIPHFCPHCLPPPESSY